MSAAEAPTRRTALGRVLVCVAWVAGAGTARTQVREVIVNGAVLDAKTVAALEGRYRTRVLPGRYWYDRRSGLWGAQGQAAAGQIDAGLPLPGRLDPRATVGRRAGVTGAFVNGREIHPLELQYLRKLFGAVPRARFWLDASGRAGYEGGPQQFNLLAAARANAGTGGPRRSLFGSTGGDGNCSYYLHPGGASVMSGNC